MRLVRSLTKPDRANQREGLFRNKCFRLASPLGIDEFMTSEIVHRISIHLFVNLLFRQRIVAVSCVDCACAQILQWPVFCVKFYFLFVSSTVALDCECIGKLVSPSDFLNILCQFYELLRVFVGNLFDGRWVVARSRVIRCVWLCSRPDGESTTTPKLNHFPFVCRSISGEPLAIQVGIQDETGSSYPARRQ